jgi:hypothetical protein
MCLGDGRDEVEAGSQMMTLGSINDDQRSVAGLAEAVAG